jgi:hypothetical protein
MYHPSNKSLLRSAALRWPPKLPGAVGSQGHVHSLIYSMPLCLSPRIISSARRAEGRARMSGWSRSSPYSAVSHPSLPKIPLHQCSTKSASVLDLMKSRRNTHLLFFTQPFCMKSFAVLGKNSTISSNASSWEKTINMSSLPSAS